MKTKFDSLKAGAKGSTGKTTPASRGPARGASAPNKGKPAQGSGKPPPFAVTKPVKSATATSAPGTQTKVPRTIGKAQGSKTLAAPVFKTGKKPVFKAEGGDITKGRTLGDSQKYVHPRSAGEVVSGAINRVFARAGKSDADKKALDDKAAKGRKALGYDP